MLLGRRRRISIRAGPPGERAGCLAGVSSLPDVSSFRSIHSFTHSPVYATIFVESFPGGRRPIFIFLYFSFLHLISFTAPTSAHLSIFAHSTCFLPSSLLMPHSSLHSSRYVLVHLLIHSLNTCLVTPSG